MLPQRIPKPPKRASRWRSPGHRAWIRKHACCACGSMRNIECAHVRLGTDGGMGFKPSDEWCISLCSNCHRMSHSVGDQTFQRDNKIDMKALAEEFIKKSPYRQKLRQYNDARTKFSWETDWEVDDC